MEAFAAAVEASALGLFARESGWTYPVANLVHLLGLVLLIGSIGLIDLRVAGAFRALPLGPLSHALTPIGIAGLACLAASGPILFAADARALVRSDFFLCKLVLIAIGLANAVAFHWLWRRSGGTVTTPMKALALGSIALWLMVAALGRLIAYA